MGKPGVFTARSILFAPYGDPQGPHSRPAPTVPAASAALDAFFDSYFRLNPVTATFAGVHEHDHALPDHSPEGLVAARAELCRVRRVLAEAGLGVLHPDDLAARDWAAIDGALADACLEVQLAELDSPHFQRGNPALAIGEALFSLVALASGNGVPASDLVAAAVSRLRAFPEFLHGARRSLGDGPLPAAWRDRTVRDCDGGLLLLADLTGWPVAEGVPVALCRALQDAAGHAAAAVDWFRAWVAGRPDADEARYAAGHGLLDLTIRRGFWCDRTVEQLRHEARAALEREQVRFADQLREAGAAAWPDVARRLAADPVAPSAVLDACAAAWREARALGEAQATWPDRPLLFVPLPPWARRTARTLSWRLYRSPAPFAPPDADRYAVPLPDEQDDGSARDAFARTWNRASIRLLHAVHHGGLGRHTQYWHAARSPSRVGRVAAVDGARRMAMHAGGPLAEGWAAYATEITEELGFLEPDERIGAERERVHIMVRAVVDLELHTGRLGFAEAVRFHHEVALVPEASARAEVTRCSMFPGTGVMRWLGLREIWRARHAAESAERAAFRAREFHDRVLDCGSVPATLVSRLVTKVTR